MGNGDQAARPEQTLQVGDDERLVSWLQSDNPEDAEALFVELEELWRTYYRDTAPTVPVRDGERPADVLELSLFAFGLMASVMRTTRAQIILAREGYSVESRALFRSMLDQAMALTELERSGVHAVHAYGLTHAENLKRLRESASRGFALGDVNDEYIARFLALAQDQPRTVELNRAQNAIKTSVIAGKGRLEAILYQAWLEATPLSKPSMRLADAYVEPQMTSEGVKIAANIDSDATSVVDPRLVLVSILPPVLKTYARIMRDEELGSRLGELDPTR